jgi:hypothetical protein
VDPWISVHAEFQFERPRLEAGRGKRFDVNPYFEIFRFEDRQDEMDPEVNR